MVNEQGKWEPHFLGKKAKSLIITSLKGQDHPAKWRHMPVVVAEVSAEWEMDGLAVSTKSVLKFDISFVPQQDTVASSGSHLQWTSLWD